MEALIKPPLLRVKPRGDPCAAPDALLALAMVIDSMGEAPGQSAMNQGGKAGRRGEGTRKRFGWSYR
jgi:hypothetical protein